jgi:hypothetical protein
MPRTSHKTKISSGAIPAESLEEKTPKQCTMDQVFPNEEKQFLPLMNA